MPRTVPVLMPVVASGLRGDLTVQASEQCVTCTHLGLAATCQAFPDGIPQDIWTGAFDHTEPHAGDHGIQYAPFRDAGQAAQPGGKAALDTAPARTTRAGAVADAGDSPSSQAGPPGSAAPPSGPGAASSHHGGPRVVSARPHEDDLERIKRAYLDWAVGDDDEETWQHVTKDDAVDDPHG